MEQFESSNDNHDIDIQYKRNIMKVLGKVIRNVKDRDKFNINAIESSDICMLLGESMDLLDYNVDWDEVSYKYMMKIKEELQNQLPYCSLFGGMCHIGFGTYSLFKSRNHYEKFLNTINKIIINSVEDQVSFYKKNCKSLKLSYYDVISGISGILAYLLLFKEENEIRKSIENILEYLVYLTEDIEVFGNKVPGWYISPQNQFLENEKEFYRNGNFNFGLSHGITGPMAAMSIALNDGIEVKGQVQSIKKIIDELKKITVVDERGIVCWPGRVRLEDYVSKKLTGGIKSRASWCYGSPGIGRALYIAGNAVGDKESIDISIKSMEGLCYMEEREWEFDSPTFCHGYAGLLAIVQAMYMDTGSLVFHKGRKKLLEKVLSFYDENSMYGFYDIDARDPINGDYKLAKRDSMDLLSGTTGIILTLLSFIKPIKTNWMRHFLIK